ncbi:A/G-specific adenine glycosylase [Aureliella helgolandensis]|uniref:Adenine DNA glycosylase n=2 Tax=Aureliella helgolandensis TaxID=2527968 RepID=A0A518GCC8_9BACT|nr:A/G-specific adenine glycosylase [Aureliella helgolandensis]
MLQQTQVATVIDYYHRFLHTFPTVSDLAAAEEQEVLTLWSGLGYYRRARQLHAAAKMVVQEFGGTFPTQFDDVLSLPGVGRYTAGAITSFAYDMPSPILEANTIRLFSRLMGLELEPTTTAAQKELWAFAESLLPRRGGGSAAINQAVMELGSLVCKPAQPECSSCSVSKFCVAYRQGTQLRLPVLKKKVPTEARVHGLVVVARHGKYLMRRNGDGKWWQGLWDFPRVDITELLAVSVGTRSVNGRPAANASKLLETEPQESSLVEAALNSDLDLECKITQRLLVLRHAVTRYKISLHCFEASLSAGQAKPLGVDWQWVELEVCDLPLTSTAAKLRRHLQGSTA